MPETKAGTVGATLALPCTLEGGLLIYDANGREVASVPLSMRDNTEARAHAELFVLAVNSFDATQTQLVELRRQVSDLRWMAAVIYIHYHNRTDLDPIQQKHLELAIRNGAPFSDLTVKAAARALLSREEG